MLSKDPRRFNRFCAALAALWLLVGVPLTFRLRSPRFHDFGQFYMAAQIARHGAWSDLYPIADSASKNNPGLAEDSRMKPIYARLAAENGVGDEPRFISPPPTALLLMPLAWLDYQHAKWAWLIFNCACGLAVALLAGKVYELSVASRSNWSGLITLLVAFSHLMYITLRALNVEPILTLLLIGGILFMFHQHSAASAAALVLAALLKYVGAVLLPLSIAIGRWRGLLWFMLWLLVASSLALIIMGRQPFEEFGELLPLFLRPYDNDASQSIYGLLMRLQSPQPGHIALLIAEITKWVTILCILLMIFRTGRERFLSQPSTVFAASASLLCWFLIFSPLAWNKYHLYLTPLWGWLAAETRGSRVRLIIVIGAIALAWGSWMTISSINLPEPLTSHMLFSAMLILGLAIARLGQARLDRQHYPPYNINQ